MGKNITPDYGQQFLFPPALEDWVPKDHPARFLREFVDQLNLAAMGFQVSESTEGRPCYAPSLLLKIWLFGYMHRIRSTRKLEAACREQLSLLWLTGMLQPDHNSLWRFWRDNKKALREVFKRSVELAVETNLTGLVLQAIDGTKIQAASSGRTGWNKKQLAKLLEALDGELDQTESQLEGEAESEESFNYRLPESLAEREALRKKVQEGLMKMDEVNRNYLHPNEVEARRMQCDGKNRFGYNAQAVVDDQAGVIVAAEVANQEGDHGLAIPLIKQAEQNCGQKTETTVGDGGYATGPDIARAMQEQVNLLVRPAMDTVAAEKRYHAYNFYYYKERDTVVCPEGQDLKFARNMKQKGQMVRIYGCYNHDCPVRSQCTKDTRQRRFVEIWDHTTAVQEMRARLKQPGAEAKLRKRKQIVERIFGHIKQHDEWRRWTVRGLEGVKSQWALVCCAFNLRLIHRAWLAKYA